MADLCWCYEPSGCEICALIRKKSRERVGFGTVRHGAVAARMRVAEPAASLFAAHLIRVLVDKGG